MKLAKFIALLGTIAMVVAIGYGFMIGDFARDGAELLANPWGVVSLVDLYVGFILFSFWIAFREGSVLAATLWIIAMMIFGFLTGALYVFITLLRCDDDWSVFFLGARAKIDFASN